MATKWYERWCWWFSWRTAEAIRALFHRDPPVPDWFKVFCPADFPPANLKEFRENLWREVCRHMEPKK
jgi:hypothetical protein